MAENGMQTMEDLQPIPLILCMENAAGEEISLRIEPEDDFQTFLDKAKSVLGFDVDINSITRNQPVSLDDNIYQFLINSEQTYETALNENYDQILEQTGENDDLVYVLDDGTQIRASQIHFDNEDPPVDLTAEKIPFVKYADVPPDDIEVDITEDVNIKNYNIVESPVSRWSSKNSSPKLSFINSLPFKLVCNNTSGFEAQFTKYLETNTNAPKTYATLNPVVNRNKSPRSLINDNFKNYNENFNRTDDFTAFTREEILNMFKDSPVASLPYKNPVLEKRRHVRKSDPSRLHKSWITKSNYDDGVLIVDSESKNCFICGKYVENNLDKLYLFDNEDQKIHRSSPQKKMSRQLKIICESCLGENFRPCRMKGPNQCLNADEYLVIRNNQQYIFQKVTDFSFKKEFDKEPVEDAGLELKKVDKEELVNVEIGSDGEIITKPVDNDVDCDDVILIKDDPSSSEPEVVEPPEIDDVIDNLDDADEEVKEFLGKYQCDHATELKCRFCDTVFPALLEVMDHCEIHKHEIEDGVVFPCPLCNYGYANVKWLKAHVKAAHEKKEKITENKESNMTIEVDKGFLACVPEEDVKTYPDNEPGSPVAKRTRSSNKKSDEEGKVSPHLKEPKEEIKQENIEKGETTIEVEVKQENIVSSDDEIWIVHTGEEQLENIFQKQGEEEKGATLKKTHKCINCSQIFTSAEVFASHKCRKRGRKPKSNDVVAIDDDVKRPPGRPRICDKKSSNDLLVERHRKRKDKAPTSDPQIVTCHNCNESFTSKVRLKFHMQFHETTSLLTSDGRYSCAECEGATFSTESELFDHVHFKHDKQKRWQCPVADCGKTFYLRATLTKHSRSHTDTRRYVCVTCGKRFLDKQTLDEHGVTHLQIKPFQCHICLKQLTRRSRLRMHLRAHEEALAPELVLVCAVCCQAFKNVDDAQEHASKSTECIEEFASELKEEEGEETQLSPTSGLVRPTVQVAESPKLSKPIKRQVDNAKAEPLLSKLADEARAIIRVVEIEKAFRCEYCEDVFYLEEGLNNHRLIHKGVKNPFICHICKVAFATYSRCTTHKTTHGFYKRPLAEAKKRAETSNLKPEAGPAATGILGYGGFPVVKHFLCGDCGRSYLHWTYLQVHRRMKHANDNFLYKCNQCELTFPNSWSLAYHRKKIHCKNAEDSGPSKASKEDYRIPCRDCEELLPNKTALYKHRKKEHSDMSLSILSKPELWCDSCGKEFFTRAGLESHQKTHVCREGQSLMPGTETPYHPSVCSQATGRPFRRSTVMRNQRSLPGVVSWSCARCSKRFRTRSDLKTHMRLKHPAYLAVIEIAGLNPSPEEVMELLRVNNIQHERVIEITKMSFVKGTSSVIPTCARALSLLSNVPQQTVDYQPKTEPEYPAFNIVRSPRRPKILQRGDETSQDNKYPMVLPGELPLLEGGGMLRLQLDDSVMLQ
ncbi:zinc finger protein Xfin-like isoform X2 [Plodia interpunctella]|uniref:zinc finger protein Xfin-like isoform X2 n=1 Tax=Plodia interpunctella TaxID=58824 RepID=UPI002367E8BB|nr:zinc finger protein Xfin-like isoform X2 [Plodia interpunctella]